MTEQQTEDFDSIHDAGDGFSWAATRRADEQSPGEGEAEAAAEAEEWEPLPEETQALTLEDKIDLVAQALGPIAHEQQRQRELDRLEQQARVFDDLSPQQALSLAWEASRQATMEQLGVQDNPLEAAIEAGVITAAQQINDKELHKAAVELVMENGWLNGSDMSPASVSAAITNAARVITDGEYVKSAKASNEAMKQQAITMSGAGVRPAAMTDDQAYFERIKAAGSGGYGS